MIRKIFKISNDKNKILCRKLFNFFQFLLYNYKYIKKSII